MLSVAKILKPFGTDGGVLVGLLDILPEELKSDEPVYLVFDGLPVPFFVEDCTPKGPSKAIIHLTDIRNTEDAAEISGKEILMDIVDYDEDSASFAGWKVLNRGELLGTVSGTEPIPGNLCLYVDTVEGRQIMVPCNENIIISLSEKDSTLDLDLPEGLDAI